MRELLERLQSATKVLDDCRLRFPGGVKIKLDQVYPHGDTVVSKEQMIELKKLHKSWKTYSSKLDNKLRHVMKPWAERHKEFAEKADKAFEKVVRSDGRDKGAWVSLNAALARAEESLYY